MPGKRKQEDVAGISSVAPSPPKRTRPTPSASKRRATDEIPSDSSEPSPAKRVKRNTHPEPRATSSSVRRPAAVRRGAKKPTSRVVSKSRLMPCLERKSAKIGHKDESLLRMLCDDTESGGQKELHFRNMLHSSIDWSDASHINKINNWRNQIYGRAGLKSKAVSMWLPDEEVWFELYFNLSIAESRIRGILVPKTLQVLAAFNKTFVGKILQDSHGNDVGPRAARQSNAFASKFNRMCPHLRARLHQCVFGKSGDTFVPEITLDMVLSYKDMKINMEYKGITKESKYNEDLQEWLHLFSHLPTVNDFPESSVDNLPGLYVENLPDSSAEDDAAAVLISMATQSANIQPSFNGQSSFNSQQSFNSGGFYGMQYTTPPQVLYGTDSSPTPELFRTSFASSQRTDGPLTPARTLSFSDDDDDSKVVSPGFCAPRSDTPVAELDIASLIASPD
ncbi:hypothetical protein HBI56_101210 [Parastagonospora nodorum]|nr:hypothetical protein HBH53_178830 [Parastagonospora nodorum]KAH4006367.1 hypothetical protein HBI10_022860 [Parastagonospora nodorum]KAH4011966.1 hypothetical protein HBI13_193220 [Parastagonospora nodorum]KAH4054675.1 hypothetical protein HBH49_065820 [Parastagonospora nodorum]KAH4066525.1 hypothetical protein HBH50_150260 [Parastagonospora nodorum]